jgi:hypothetical protein
MAVIEGKTLLASCGSVQVFREPHHLYEGFFRIWVEVFGVVVDETEVNCEAEVITNLQFRMNSLVGDLNMASYRLALLAEELVLPFFVQEKPQVSM